MNLPNKLTLFRILLTPFFVVFLLAESLPLGKGIALIIFILASLTDLIDGKIARKYNMITDFGKFLDPLADKILTASALVCFAELRWLPGWTVAIVIAREFIVSGIRLLAAGSPEKTVISADLPGKLKTAFTMAAIVIILFLRCAESSFPSDFPINVISGILSYITAALTVWSGAGYVWKYRALFLKSK